jgi:hypothetical protein
MERFGAMKEAQPTANSLKALIGAWGFEPQTPTVSTPSLLNWHNT